ncbi:MAG: alkaline phosphatase PhoX [Acidimicrobiales bacterium]
MTGPKTRVARRHFLGGAAAAAAGAAAGINPFAALAASAAGGRPVRQAGLGEGGYGPLAPVADLRDGVARLALPAGFSYLGFSFEGDSMSDGNLVPKGHDGTGAFALANGNVRLIRNHEDRDSPGVSPLDGGLSAPFYDVLGPGGTTTLEVRTLGDGRSVELVRDFVSIQGTIVNCAGGIHPPSQSWLTCEETTAGVTQGWTKPHGYVFEVPVAADAPVSPVPLTAMGRFVHEATATDPRTGIVYETEDRGTAGFYRFVPVDSANLSAGGTLQMLAVQGKPGYDTTTGQTVGEALPVTWVDIADPDPAAAETNSLTVFNQGLEGGGATFSRLEGAWYSDGEIFFNSTSGGDAGTGQVWNYKPNRRTGEGVVRLMFESPSDTVLSNPDNICVSPAGGVVLCEDGDLPTQYLRGLTSDGRIFDFAHEFETGREWTGATFSPDGNILFVNIQGDLSIGGPGNLGKTFAIWGPFETGAL